jgi:mRNA interferase RelE/StbE
LTAAFAISEHGGVPLILSRDAIEGLAAMPKKERSQLRARLNAIAAEPAGRHPGVRALRGAPSGRFRARQGDWRAIFSIEGADVVVERIGNRREVYR